MLKIYTGNRLERLLEKMDMNICSAGSGPLTKVPICIQTPGMQRWIGIKLAELTGISANLDFIFPGALMKRLAGVGAGEKAPWPEKNELVWKVYSKLNSLPSEQFYEHIRNYLEGDINGIRAYRLAGRIADVFDQYQVYRPQMVLDWLSVKPKNPPVEDNDIWQMELFRSIFPHGSGCKTTIFDKFIKNCTKGANNCPALKTPIHIFGISVLPAFFIEMLKAASQYTDIYFYLLSPTRQYWGDSKTIREKRRLEKITQKSAEELYIEEKHELLDNLGVIGRDFFDYLFGSDDSFLTEEEYFDIAKNSVLQTVQAEILDLEYGNEKPSHDNSIIINNCHNPLREMETLYDQLLELFNNDQTLRPSDILVMTTDIEKYAPYIKAVFDNPYSERERIPYSIADVSEKQTNRPAGIFLELLSTLRGDFSLADVMRILSYDLIADKFSIKRSDLSTLSTMLQNAGAMWSYGREHLRKEGLTIDDTFTWERALRRVALGLAEGSSGSIYSEAAVKNVPFSLSVQIGGLMRFADLSSKYAEQMDSEKTIPEWCALMQALADDYIKETFDNADDILHLSKCIADINTEAENGDFTEAVPAAPVLERLTESLSETRGAKGFISGRVTFCAMLPMRSIPFRVICVAGLDENTFPRQKVSLEFDLMAKSPKPGDRNNRDSDRYLFLETLISAQDTLILSYTGQSERDNAELLPSTLITELNTHLKGRFGIEDITLKQKLHSFSRDYFSNEKLFTYSSDKYNTSRAFSSEKTGHRFSTLPIEVQMPDEVSLADFENFFISPPDYFLRKVLEIRPKLRDESLPENEIMCPDPLLQYKIIDNALRERLEGKDPDNALEYLYKTAQLPPENLGRLSITETLNTSMELNRTVTETLGGTPEEQKIDSAIDGLHISGTIFGVSGNRYVYAKPASIKPKDIIRGWIRHLLLCQKASITTTLCGGGNTVEIPPADSGHLNNLVEIFKEGHKSPLRFHITDGIRELNDRVLKSSFLEDSHNSVASDYAFRICFGADTTLDRDAAEKIINPLLLTLRGAK
ncbi:exodeoxyribonuclease V, gamma subunit [Denitrovibrio acetiphilus DSM 12809]|uniref:RecBCD enzyme subunit RecC n=1 Tax=Denitrovibrio acetiphilus (strain DSM 12809 / NBRC 114555 / N2460) TaxID=522772 RepID=D4H411_DENA2|nr:exodeoxyribonuclease V subunit gamma [Denitrovibrio acetiphilus]ADD67322.1 exodeoxyribonuclease V, gamma subunit [Denitrovibrio acetiphilus DSM 12809]